MIAACADRLLHETRLLTGRLLAGCRLHRIRHAHVESVEITLKSRRFGGGVAIHVGNLYLRLQGSDVAVLNDHEWLRWEVAVEAAANQGVVLLTIPTPYDNFPGLVSRRCIGLPLRNILIESVCSLDEKFAAIGWAMASLQQLHRCRADWGNGTQQSISHGDATVNNVIVHTKTQSACWIDFDTRHLPHLSEPDRHADDLRALIYSAAAHLPQTCFPRLAAELIASCPERLVLQRFHQRLTTDWRRPNTFQLAQASLSWKDSVELSQTLLQSLSVMAAPRPAGFAIRNV
jgi:hypothetical protein